MSESTSAASAYVGMTRARHDNIAHLVAETPEQAKTIWESACGRDRADLGVAHARLQAIDDIDRYGSNGPAKTRVQAVAAERRKAGRRKPDRRHVEPRRTEPLDPVHQSNPGPSIGF